MKPSKSPDHPKLVKNTISYFSFFGFSPTFEEIYRFYPEVVSRTKLKEVLNGMVIKKSLHRSMIKVVELENSVKKSGVNVKYSIKDRQDNLNNRSTVRFKETPNISLYTLPQYSIHTRNRLSRQSISKNKLISASPFIWLLSLLPCIRLVGISGSCAMLNSRPHDDVDLFIIMSPKLLFTGRLWAIFFASVLGKRNGRDSVCLNLFMDEEDLIVPASKRNRYVAHEILQMKPIIDKNNTYGRFISANKWAFRLFPNAKQKFPQKDESEKRLLLQPLWSPIEYVLQTIQTRIIKRNKTGFIMTDTQLWLFKKDFETRLKKLL